MLGTYPIPPEKDLSSEIRRAQDEILEPEEDISEERNSTT